MWVKFSSLIIVLFVIPCYGAEPSETTTLASTNTAMIQTFTGLALVVGCIYFLAWAVKRLNLGGFGQNNTMKVVSALPLGAREKAILIDVKGQQILIGVSPGRVSTLHVFETPVVDDLPVNETEEDAVKSKSMVSSLAANSASEFSKKLNVFLGQGNKLK